MSEQLHLVEVEPRLTDRQRFALDQVRSAGEDGLLPAELGAIWHARQLKHSPEEQCEWCGQDGARLLHELYRKRLVRRVRGAAVAVTASQPEVRQASAQTDEIPF